MAGLNVLPKAGWYTSYSHRVTRDMNQKLLKELQHIWLGNHFVSDTINLDFTVIPYWGDDSHLQNNWSGKRHKALASMLAVLAQDPDSGIITYGDTNVRHENESKVVLEFLDFYQQNKIKGPKYLVFDSKFTTYENLSHLDEKGVKFITIQKKKKNIVEQLESKPSSDWKKIRVMKADGKGRILKVVNETLDKLQDYNKRIRQVAITGHAKIKPCLIITNDFQIKLEDLIRKYARRWIVEKEISGQIDFFHLN
ncbi:MAG: transposase, partial [Deltaproteobacteria bacterium]|nr:transposase [Deltaproteobacteria bacterium]